MKIIIPDEKNDSIITKTLPVRPNMSAKDVCKLVFHAFFLKKYTVRPRN